MIRVGVFPFRPPDSPGSKRGPRYTAYTLWFNPSWSGCCLHNVEAKSGTEAKKIAISEHKKNCVALERPAGVSGERQP